MTWHMFGSTSTLADVWVWPLGPGLLSLSSQSVSSYFGYYPLDGFTEVA